MSIREYGIWIYNNLETTPFRAGEKVSVLIKIKIKYSKAFMQRHDKLKEIKYLGLKDLVKEND
jgi:hypothetical protein